MKDSQRYFDWFQDWLVSGAHSLCICIWESTKLKFSWHVHPITFKFNLMPWHIAKPFQKTSTGSSFSLGVGPQWLRTKSQCTLTSVSALYTKSLPSFSILGVLIFPRNNSTSTVAQNTVWLWYWGMYHSFFRHRWPAASMSSGSMQLWKTHMIYTSMNCVRSWRWNVVCM